ncbi:MAG: AAA family ATPase [Sneathiella sp.]
MRIKTYTAPTMEKAINQLRLEMGPEAIILSSQNLKTGEVQLTAAVEQLEAPIPSNINEWASDWDRDWKVEANNTVTPKPDVKAKKEPSASSQSAETSTIARNVKVTPKMDLLVQSMAFHGIPTQLAERLCRMALSVKTDDTAMALAAALDNHFNYSSRISGRKAPLILVGPPGVGKTATIAKFAAAAKMEGRTVQLVTTDTKRAGAIEQLQAYTDILEFDLNVAESAAELKALIQRKTQAGSADILIDTGGINAYDDDEVANLTKYIIAARAEPIVVLAAGTDTAEMSDTAETFASLGARRMIVTRLDTTRRYGGIFTAAQTANLSFSYASVSSSVANGLHIINPVNLARLLLRDPTHAEVGKEFDKVKP